MRLEEISPVLTQRGRLVNASAGSLSVQPEGLIKHNSFIGELEQQLNATGANVVALRPGYFMENLLTQVPAIRTQGVVQYPYAEDHDIPFISVVDIAAVAAHYLLHPQWTRQWTRNLMGPANLTLPACATLLAQAWGHPFGISANRLLTCSTP